jgi:GNAT superfamily N-acetyltransferase
MEYRHATEHDLNLLAEWNHHLIQDEGHRNSMTIPELQERMSNWIAGEYKAVLFLAESEPVAYGLYRETEEEVYLRQFFVQRDRRRGGIGRQALALFRERIWPRNKRLTVEVLCKNAAGIQFWRAVGYEDYSLQLEILPESK